MKIAITSKKEITSKKDGTLYVVVEGFSEKGATVKAFLNPDQQREAPVMNAPTKENIAEAFELLQVVNFEFNDQGRVEGITEE
jgi:molybdopterin-guanine dinucleotide biosynthesis protein